MPVSRPRPDRLPRPVPDAVGLLIASLPPGLTVPTAAETRAYVARMRAAGPDGTIARHEFFTRNVPLALHLTRRYHARSGRPERPFADLVSAACEGLLLAVDRFDPDDGARFSTYATFWVKQSIQRLVMADRLVAVPVYLQDALAARKPSTRKLHRRGAAEKRVRCLEAGQAVLKAAIELDSDRDRNEVARSAYAADPAPGPAERAELADELARLGGWLGRLRVADPRLATVLVLRFGLDGGALRTFREIGRAIGKTAQRSQQLYESALGRLREIAGVEVGAGAL